MYALNGIPLDNPTFGWRFRAPSKPLSDFTIPLSSLSIPNRDGYIDTPFAVAGPSLPLMVYTPRATMETLYALLFSSPLTLSLASTPQREVKCTVSGITNTTAGKPNRAADVLFVARLNGVYWRSTTVSTSTATALIVGSLVIPVFPGISAPVRDAMIRVQGPASNLRVDAGGGSWFAYGQAIPAGSYLRFESDSGRAYLTATNVWTGGTDVTQYISNGAGPYSLSIVPTFTDPSSRTGQITATCTAMTAPAAIEVRGKGAYVFAEA